LLSILIPSKTGHRPVLSLAFINSVGSVHIMTPMVVPSQKLPRHSTKFEQNIIMDTPHPVTDIHHGIGEGV